MSDNKQAITLQPANIGKLTSDVIRASLHSANPSAVLRYIMSGVVDYIKETAIHSDAKHDLYHTLFRRLLDVRNEILTLEDKL